MKICFLQNDFPPENFGGAGVIVYRYAKEFLSRGHQVFVIATVQDKNKEKVCDYEGIKVFYLYHKYPDKWRAWLSLCNYKIDKKVKNILKVLKPDVVHAHIIHFYLSYHCLQIAKKYSKAVFLTNHDVMLFNYGKLTSFIDYNNLSIPREFNYKVSFWDLIKQVKWRYNPFRGLAIRHYLKYVDKIFCVSDALNKALADNNFRNIKTIHNGIKVKYFEKQDKQGLDNFKDKFGLRNRKVIFFNGRLRKAKGGEQLLKATQLVKKRVGDVMLLISGDQSNYIYSLLRLGEKLGLSKDIVFTGWLGQEDIKLAYQSCDLCVVPSICFDSFPTVILEAMAIKKPVVATCFGGSREIVEDGKTGYIINPLNIEKMAEKIVDLLENPEKAKNFGEAGYQRIKEKFSLDKQTEKTLEYYQIALENNLLKHEPRKTN